MNIFLIIIEILAVLLISLEAYAFIQHLFQASKGAFILKIENPKRQIIIHSSFDQIAIGFIVNYESGFFISLHILNLHFCFVYIPVGHRQAISPTVLQNIKPLVNIITWMTNGIDKANEIGGASELYFKPLQQGYDLEDIDRALQHFRSIGATALWDMHKEEIILKL